MYVNVGEVNGLFHTEAINRKFNQNTGSKEEKKSVLLRGDFAVISQKGKAMSAVERLMKQKDFIRECKASLLEKMVDKENGYCSSEIAKKIEEYEKQLDSIDEEIAKELAKPTDERDENREDNIYKGKRPSTKQELNNKKIAELTAMCAKLDQSERMDSVKNRMEGEKNVLEAELKSGDSERKRQRIEEIEDRTVELTKETFAEIGEIIGEKKRCTGKKETKGINILPRKDVATISPMGKASSALQNLVNQIEVNQEGIKDQNLQKDSGHVNDENSPGTVKYKISKEGQEHFQNQVENGTQGTFSDQNFDWKKVQLDSIYNGIIEKSDNGFNNPTIEMELRGTYNVYLNEAYEQGKAYEVNIYDHIVNIHKDSLMKAYQDVYNDIVTGYENGTREVWTQDFEEGADYTEFELEGKSYRFHKLTMEEELARLDRAYEQVARIAEDGANRMINTQKLLEKVIPEYQEKMREIEAQRAGIKTSKTGESAEMIAERVKNKISMTEQNTGRINLFEMLMEARKNWLNTEKTGLIYKKKYEEAGIF